VIVGTSSWHCYYIEHIQPDHKKHTTAPSLSPIAPPRCLQKHGSASPAPSTTRATTPRSAACVCRPVRALSSACRLPLPRLPRRYQLLFSRPLLPLHPSPRSLPLSAASLPAPRWCQPSAPWPLFWRLWGRRRRIVAAAVRSTAAAARRFWRRADLSKLFWRK
jgi:hypothetical protein